MPPIVKHGSPLFWQIIARYNDAARSRGPVFCLTDLDNNPCPSGLIAKHLPRGRNPGLLLRIAVRELESWLLADAKALAAFLGLSEAAIPREPDELADPKQALVNVARRVRKVALREALVPEDGTSAKVGPDYVGEMGHLIADHWDPARAASRSPSLARAREALARLR